MMMKKEEKEEKGRGQACWVSEFFSADNSKDKQVMNRLLSFDKKKKIT